MDNYISLVERECMQICNETLKPGHVSNRTQALMVRGGPVKKLSNMFIHYTGRKRSKNQKWTSIFNVCFELKIK